MKYLVMLLFLPLLSKGQLQSDVKIFNNNAKGIHWTTGLTWQEVKEKAKKENKHIFLDFFATWCGPCKMMDKDTYPDSALGVFMNEKYISVKVQMDKTARDNEEIKSWYEDAQRLGNEYAITAYPSLVFLSPSGEFVSKATGLQRPPYLNRIAKAALDGKKLKDPFEEYNTLLTEYQSGAKNYKKMPRLFKWAIIRNNPETAWPVAKEYVKYLESIKEKEWYTKETIEFLSAQSLTTSSPFYKMFEKNAKKVDRAVGKKGYAKIVLHWIVLREIAGNFLNIDMGSKSQAMRRDTSEADWDGLYRIILQKYSDSYADKVVLDAKLIWYWQHANMRKFNSFLIPALDKYGLDAVNPTNGRSFARVYSYYWDVVRIIKDSAQLELGVKWMREVVKHSTEDVNHTLWIDNYSDLLYKIGRTKEGLEWKEKGLKIAEEKGYTAYANLLQRNLPKMQKGELIFQ